MARRRRRQKNPMVMRILVAVLVAHAIALPIAARYGAFDKLKKEFGSSRVVMINVPEVEEPKKKKAPEKPKKAPKTAPAKKAAAAAPKSTSTQKSNLPRPNVVATATAGPGGEGGPTVEQGTGRAGVLPANPNPTGGGATKPPEPPPAPPSAPPTNDDRTVIKPPPTVPPPSSPPAPAPKRIVQASADYAPEPQIPDDLRTEPFEKTLVVEADIDTGGHPTQVRVAESTGNKELDDIGLDTARRYRFHPATVNDEPVPQHVRFRIIFKVE